MLNISGIHQGFVLDHIKAGESMTIYNDLHLANLGCDCTVAMIMNAKSNKMGRKDIIKIECPIERVDLDILGFIDHNITCNIIKDDAIVEKRKLTLPKEIKNVISCKNPRCISTVEQELDQVFILTDEENEVYRCKYCEEKYTGKK
jgi:aspartate carbamoyltransferase regulatory subunit